MSNFDSPISKKSFTSQPQTEKPLKQFTVSDPDFEDPTFPFNQQGQVQEQFQQRQLSPAEIEELARLRKAQQNNNMVNNSLKERINYLANIGRLTKEITLGNSVFALRTLKNKENKEISLSALKTSTNDMELGFEIRRQVLARSVFQIDGIEIEMILGSNSLESKLKFIDELEETITNVLYSAYEELRNQAASQFAIKNSDDAKEVIENLKK